MTAAPDPRDVVRKLKTRPGRGGVRLSYEEAQLLLGMIRAGGVAIKRERLRRIERDPLNIGGPFA